METNKLLTIQQVAERFQVSKETIRKWKGKSILKGVKIDRIVRFSESEVNQLLKSKKAN